MKHIKRTSSSSEYPKLLEYLQGGILVRFNVVEEVNDEITSFNYDEFWFSIDSDVDYIEQVASEHGFSFTDEYKGLLQ